MMRKALFIKRKENLSKDDHLKVKYGNVPWNKKPYIKSYSKSRPFSLRQRDDFLFDDVFKEFSQNVNERETSSQILESNTQQPNYSYEKSNFLSLNNGKNEHLRKNDSYQNSKTWQVVTKENALSDGNPAIPEQNSKIDGEEESPKNSTCLEGGARIDTSLLAGPMISPIPEAEATKYDLVTMDFTCRTEKKKSNLDDCVSTLGKASPYYLAALKSKKKKKTTKCNAVSFHRETAKENRLTWTRVFTPKNCKTTPQKAQLSTDAKKDTASTSVINLGVSSHMARDSQVYETTAGGNDVEYYIADEIPIVAESDCESATVDPVLTGCSPTLSQKPSNITTMDISINIDKIFEETPDGLNESPSKTFSAIDEESLSENSRKGCEPTKEDANTSQQSILTQKPLSINTLDLSISKSKCSEMTPDDMNESSRETTKAIDEETLPKDSIEICEPVDEGTNIAQPAIDTSEKAEHLVHKINIPIVSPETNNMSSTLEIIGNDNRCKSVDGDLSEGTDMFKTSFPTNVLNEALYEETVNRELAYQKINQEAFKIIESYSTEESLLHVNRTPRGDVKDDQDEITPEDKNSSFEQPKARGSAKIRRSLCFTKQKFPVDILFAVPLVEVCPKRKVERRSKRIAERKTKLFGQRKADERGQTISPSKYPLDILLQ